MALDAVTNFGYATLAAGIDSDDTSITLATGQGARLPAGPFNAVIWDTSYSSPTAAYHASAAEIVRVTTRTTDTLSPVTRAQEGTTARSFNTGGRTYAIGVVLTKATYDQLAPLASPTFTGTATVETLVITKGVTIAPAPMDALAIDINEQNNTKDLAADSTLTFSATPTAGKIFGATLTETSGSDITVEIPECYSVNQGGLITEFVLTANSIAELGFRHDGTKVIITGDPRTQAQDRTALGLGDSATKNTGTAAGTVAAGDHGHGSSAISDFASASRAQTEAMLVAGENVTLTPGSTGATRTITIASTGGGGGGGTFSMDDGDATADPATIASFDDGDATTA